MRLRSRLSTASSLLKQTRSGTRRPGIEYHRAPFAPGHTHMLHGLLYIRSQRTRFFEHVKSYSRAGLPPSLLSLLLLLLGYAPDLTGQPIAGERVGVGQAPPAAPAAALPRRRRRTCRSLRASVRPLRGLASRFTRLPLARTAMCAPATVCERVFICNL